MFVSKGSVASQLHVFVRPFFGLCLCLGLGCQTSGSTGKSTAKVEKASAGSPTASAAEGLEVADGWRVRDWGNPGRYEVIADEKNPANRIGRLSFMKAKEEKTAVSLDPTDGFTQSATVTFDLYNGSEKPVKVAVAVKTLPDYDYYESPPVEIRPKKLKKRITVPLNAKTFKSQLSEWEHKAAIPDVTAAYQLVFLVYSDLPAGYVCLDDVRLVAGD